MIAKLKSWLMSKLDAESREVLSQNPTIGEIMWMMLFASLTDDQRKKILARAEEMVDQNDAKKLEGG